MTELEHYISNYFGVMAVDELKSIVSFFQPMRLTKGDYLQHVGKSCDKLCFVQSGLLRMYAVVEDKEVTQWISSKGYFATDLASFMFEKPSRLNIQALVDTDVFVITKENYKKISTFIPKWNELEKLFLIRCFIFIEERIFSHLSMSAEERYQFFFEKNKELFNQVPMQYLASMLGMTPETFSRIRKKQVS